MSHFNQQVGQLFLRVHRSSPVSFVSQAHIGTQVVLESIGELLAEIRRASIHIGH